MKQHPFSLPTHDRLARLTGQLDLPEGEPPEAGWPLMLLASGGWFMDRDGDLDDPPSEAGLLYRQLAQAALRRGIAALRHDNRGVKASAYSMPPVDDETAQDPLASTLHYLRHCVDMEARAQITPETYVDDLAQIYDFGAGHRHIDPARIAVVAHSEGALHTARLVERRRIDVSGALLLGAIVESPVGIVRWQSVERYVDGVMAWGDGCVTTRAQVEARYPTEPLFAHGQPSLQQLCSQERWDRESLTAFLEQLYLATKDEALGRDPGEPYPEPSPEMELVAASHAWWQQWFLDDTPVLSRFRDFEGLVSYHLGSLDSQAPAARQFALAEELRRGLSCDLRLHLHEGRGHSFCTGHPTSGPIDAEALKRIADELHGLLF